MSGDIADDFDLISKVAGFSTGFTRAGDWIFVG
jgi:hypothetical protein